MIDNLIFPIDHIILTIGLIIVIFCFWKGIISSILGLLTWIGSILITIYFYSNLSEIINKQLLKIELIKNYEQIVNLISVLFSIPIIFLLTLFILKKFRKIISSDIDSQIFGKIIDKFFGFLFGFIFNYIFFSTIIYGLNNFEFLDNLEFFLKENSYVIQELDKLNQNLFKFIFFNSELNVT
ncbi:CvpA family protein [Pelagibacterales bacterium SAG-MED31]|nr:CvpA family protein [Pelagibacterales bacterium SAG-MED31]